MYDATGVRFQAGKHAALLHHIVTQLPDDHPASQNYERLKDVLGHTPQVRPLITFTLRITNRLCTRHLVPSRNMSG